jgi:hypothetical protein
MAIAWERLELGVAEEEEDEEEEDEDAISAE